ncbi:helix-turn-helix domain-containing protein [Pseudonocardia sp. ICBG1293]|uniref:helix-turn-helix domain-containing protein n=1 Tax=Pseudonocardia sp. ICBG1293 TaxID=2844382 RepID=UPI001CCD7D72|nr:helix-turn-helix domain-containing protein [Pseudonocardia sp. ICBG1293]
MSVKAVEAVFRSDLGSRERMVLLALADHVNADDGRNVCWPSVRLLARKTGSSRSTVQRAIRELRELELLQVVRRFRPNRSQRSNGYRVMLSELQRRELAAAQAKAQTEAEELEALFEREYPSCSGADPALEAAAAAEVSAVAAVGSGTLQAEGLIGEDLQVRGGVSLTRGGCHTDIPRGCQPRWARIGKEPSRGKPRA